MKREPINWLRSAVAVLLLIVLTVGTLGCKTSMWIDPIQTTGAISDTDPADTIPADTTVANQDTQDSILPFLPEDNTQEGQQTQPGREESAETRPDSTHPSVNKNPTAPTEGTEPSVPDVTGQLKVHFIDVGQADAALIQCDGKNMLIDGGNAADSNLMYTYLKKQGVTHLDYVIGTHAHEDHIGGIAGALQYATVGTVYCPVKNYSSKAFTNFSKAVTAHGASITVPSVGISFSLGEAKVKILAVNTSSDINNSSIVLRITYGSTSFLFTGDAEREVEQALINRDAPLESTVLKVGHHGSSTSSGYQFLWNVMPKYAVISVGKGNSYGHPHQEVLSRLRDADTKLYRTDLQGDIVCTSNGSSVSFKVSRNANADTFGGIGSNSTQPTDPPETQTPTTQPTETKPPATEPAQTEPPVTEAAQADYIINKNSRVFHEPDCVSVFKMSEKNKVPYTGTSEELIDQGYTPCKNCDP